MVASTRIFQGNELNKQINSIDHSPDADDIRRVLRQYTQHDPDSGFKISFQVDRAQSCLCLNP